MGELCTSKLAAHDRLADLLVNPMTRGLPGGSGTSETAGMQERETEGEKGNEIRDSHSQTVRYEI